MNNEAIKTILNRRTFRKYKKEQISKEELSAIIDCGLYAPSAMNTQGWHFTVIQNPHLIEWMDEQIAPKLPDSTKERMTARNGGDENFSVFYFAPTVILVSGKAGDKFSPMNVSFATENMCLAAEALNIGSCIVAMAMYLFDDEKASEYKAELGIPTDYEPYYAICLGYKDDTPQAAERILGKVNYIL